MYNGECSTCTYPSKPDSTGRSCVTSRALCNDRQSISPDGSVCYPCQPYTRA